MRYTPKSSKPIQDGGRVRCATQGGSQRRIFQQKTFQKEPTVPGRLLLCLSWPGSDDNLHPWSVSAVKHNKQHDEFRGILSHFLPSLFVCLVTCHPCTPFNSSWIVVRCRRIPKEILSSSRHGSRLAAAVTDTLLSVVTCPRLVSFWLPQRRE